MEQWTIVIVLLTIAIILLFASFFVKDNDRKFADEMSEYTLQLTEEIHELKQRIIAVEEELGKEVPVSEDSQTVKKVHNLTKQHIITLYTSGRTFDEIAEQLSVPITTVQLVVDNYIEQSIV